MSRPLRVCLDAGHGGKDSGAVGPNGTEEAKITLQIVAYLKALLLSSGIECVSTRTRDTTVPLPDRLGIARSFKADLFLSIHCNSGPNGAEGMETIYELDQGPLHKEFAQCIQDTLAIDFKFHRNRGIKDSESDDYPRSIYVVKKAPCIAAIVEVEFLSSPKQEFWLRKPETHDALAFSLRKAIIAFAAAHLSVILEE